VPWDAIAGQYPSLATNGRKKPWPAFVRSRVYHTRDYALFSLYPNGVTWAKRVWFTRGSLEAFLRKHGQSWEQWSARHPASARILVAQSPRGS
jgi:hypothetical protein